MAVKTFTFALSITVRDMTDEEFEASGGLDFATDEEDSSPEGFAESIGKDELASILSDALQPENSDEIFAGTDTYLILMDARVSPIDGVE